MPIEIVGDSSTNAVDIPAAFLGAGQGRIELPARGGTIQIGAGCKPVGRLHLIVGEDATLTIGPQCRLGHLFVFIRTLATISIGANTVFNGAGRLQAHEAAGITIGAQCLIAGDTNFMSSDMHAMIDVESGERINPAAEIVLGDHVWVGSHATILKGARIGTGSVVGFGSVVGAMDVAANTLLAGAPARVVRTGVTWRHGL